MFSEKFSKLLDKSGITGKKLSLELGLSETILTHYKKGISKPTEKN
jgi:hypothetical protein